VGTGVLVAAREMYRLLEQSQDEISEEWPVYHGASYVPCPVPLLDLAFFYYPDQIKQKDARGLLPIHYVASCPYHDVTFDIPQSMISGAGVSPYIRAQHRTSFCDLSPITKVIRHYPEAASIVTPDGRLPLHIALEMIKDHQSTFRVACQSQVLTSISSQNEAVPWEVSRFIIRSFVEVNTTAFERQDPQTCLYPFMQAAVGDNADVDSVYSLLREHPSICMLSMGATAKEDPSVMKDSDAKRKCSSIENTGSNAEKPQCRYALGQPIQKVFGVHQGRYEGVVTMLPTPSIPYYRVFYPADADEEDIAVEEMPKYVMSNVGGLRHPNNWSRGPKAGLR